ncbi:MAG TPA: methyltransferase domain-containing protein [Selenomonadales bacterium]|nr:methyltransferase domain-containing protein [Selenomonadales bacterium]
MDLVNKVLGIWNLKISEKTNIKTNNEGYEVYQYLDKKGNFDYTAYRDIQIEANKRKIENVWVKEENVVFLSQYIIDKIGHPRFGICHGTRRGLEQKWFSKQLKCEVIGTEISDTATQFPNTVQWDFHEVNPNWVNKVDFIYSNAFDHSYDPEKCLNAWVECLTKKGICIIEQPERKGAKKTDPFGANILLMPYLILKWGKGKYYTKEILKAPEEISNNTFFLVICKD